MRNRVIGADSYIMEGVTFSKSNIIFWGFSTVSLSQNRRTCTLREDFWHVSSKLKSEMEANYTAWDELFDAGKASELLPKLKEALASDEKNAEILWRTSRCIFEIGTNEETNDAKVRFYL